MPPPFLMVKSCFHLWDFVGFTLVLNGWLAVLQNIFIKHALLAEKLKAERAGKLNCPVTSCSHGQTELPREEGGLGCQVVPARSNSTRPVPPWLFTHLSSSNWAFNFLPQATTHRVWDAEFAPLSFGGTGRCWGRAGTCLECASAYKGRGEREKEEIMWGAGIQSVLTSGLQLGLL